LDNWMSDERIDLAYIGRALQRLTDEVSSLRDDMQVLTAIVQRLDNSHTRLLTEIRATHSQVSRVADRVRRLERAAETEHEPPP
jgi:t-SNARE complex subunit (syntaxin)